MFRLMAFPAYCWFARPISLFSICPQLPPPISLSLACLLPRRKRRIWQFFCGYVNLAYVGCHYWHVQQCCQTMPSSDAKAVLPNRCVENSLSGVNRAMANEGNSVQFARIENAQVTQACELLLKSDYRTTCQALNGVPLSVRIYGIPVSVRICRPAPPLHEATKKVTRYWTAFWQVIAGPQLTLTSLPYRVFRTCAASAARSGCLACGHSSTKFCKASIWEGA